MKATRNILFTTVLCASFFCCAEPANAAFITGNQLKQLLDSDEMPVNQKTVNDVYDSGDAIGYITGVYDMLGPPLVCSQPGVTRGQLRQIVRKHLMNNPENWNFTANVIVTQAFMNAFPCPKKAQ